MKLISKANFEQQISLQELKSGSLFGALSDACIDYMLLHGKLYYAQPGDKIFDYGDRGDSFFVVCRGCLSFIKQHEGKRLHTRDIGFGEEAGFVAMIALHDHSGYAIAKSDSLVLEISSALYSELHEKFSFDFGIITLNLARDMARAMRNLSNALVTNSINH